MLQIEWAPQLPDLTSDCLLVVAVTAEALDRIESRFGASVGSALTRAGFKAQAGQTFGFSVIEPAFVQVVLIGVDEPDTAGARRKFGFDGGCAASDAGVSALVLDTNDVFETIDAAVARQISEGLELSGYSFDMFKSEEARSTQSLERVTLIGRGSGGPEISRAIEAGKIIADAIAQARDLGNGPAEQVTPTFLAQSAVELGEALRGEGHDVQVEVFERDECERRSMGLYLAVARGSTEPPKFIHMTYKPKDQSRGRVCLVGKGVTFDSGGYSLKPSDGMLQMKLDMGGAAAVIGAMGAIARLELEYEVHVISAAAENMVSGNAYRLGDVFRASNGTTVEINNTDAEGRLTLADALVFAASLEPDLVIDFATLTGACIVALGPHICGVMTRDDALASAWLAAGESSGEDMWRLPLPKPLNAMLDSKIADLRNTGKRAGGALTAGLFLEHFHEGKRWMHVDIAGPAIVDEAFGVNGVGSSGVPVATIVEFLTNGL